MNLWTSALYTATQGTQGSKGQSVLVYGVDPNGSVWFVQEVAGGSGVYGGPTHSQGSMVVVKDKLFVANPMDGSVGMYQINTTNATDLVYKDYQDVWQGGNPTALAGTEDWGGVLVSVGTWFDNTTGMGGATLSGYYWDDTLIHSNSSWNRDLNISIDMTTTTATSAVAFSPDNDFLVIQFKGLPTIAAMVFGISSNGMLDNMPKVYPPTSPLGSTSFGFSFFGDDWVVSTDAGKGVNLYQINELTGVVNASTTWISPPNAAAACWSTSDNMTDDVYAIFAHTGHVVEVSVLANSLKLQGTPVATGWIPLTDAVTTPQWSDGKKNTGGFHSLWVLAPGRGIAQFNITGPGRLSVVGNNPVPFPMSANTTNVAGLAAYSVWSYHSGAGSIYPSVVLIALLCFFVLNIKNL